jgi:oligoribonuclease NrnB/cAMP/cGMP phosphodiesterase (DHH superfamily)
MTLLKALGENMTGEGHFIDSKDAVNVVIYHDNCIDGWSAAYIAKQKYPNAELLPQDYGLEPPYKKVEGKDVLVVDFSWNTREKNDKMASLAKSFFILDHHKTAQTRLKDAPYAIFDMNRSGAGLTWDYLFGLPRPLWIDYVEDRDLWRYRFPSSKEVNAYISTLPRTIKAWDSLSKLAIEQAVQLGRGVLDYIEQNVQQTIGYAQNGRLLINEKCYRVSMVNTSWNHSDIGNRLAKNADIGVVWFECKNDMIQFSLHSVGEIDVSEIAEIFDGGGHKNASGFNLSVGFGRYIIDRILIGEKLEIH